MKIQSWEVLESTTPYPHLRVDSCLLPSGKVISKLIHEYSEWATVLAVTEARDVVLVRQYRHGVKQTILELPGGVIDPGENPLDAAKRELLEETGYGEGKWLELAAPSPNPDNHTNRIHCFLAIGVNQLNEPHQESDEEIEVSIQPIKKMIKMALAGELIQSMHLATIFLALPHLGVDLDGI